MVHTSGLSKSKIKWNKLIVVLCKAGLNTVEVLLWARGKSLDDVRRRLKKVHESVKEKVEEEQQDDGEEEEMEEDAVKMMMQQR